MKRFLKIFICSTILICSGNCFVYAAENYSVEEMQNGYVVCSVGEAFEFRYGTLFIDHQVIESQDMVAFCEKAKTVHFPLRTVLEGMGAAVHWDPETGNITVFYQEETYLFEFEQEEKEGFTVRNLTTDHLIGLSPMTYRGFYMMKNDRIYLYQQTAEFLLNEFDAFVHIDDSTNTVAVRKKKPEDETPRTGTLSINGVGVDVEHPVIFYQGNAWFPLLDVFGALGAEFQWNPADESLEINDQNEQYLITFHSYEEDQNGKYYQGFKIFNETLTPEKFNDCYLYNWISDKDSYRFDEIGEGLYLEDDQFEILKQSGYDVVIDYDILAVNIITE